VLTSTLMKRFLGVLASLALALGLVTLATPPASAASTVWDKVAKCESGNRWGINTGNGYYGGLQFSPRTWSGFGGRQYASQANKASKGEQIAVARRVLAVQGPGAWPHCSRVAGLTKSNGKANRNATPSSNPGAKAPAKKSPAKKASPKKASPSASKAKTIRVRSGDTLGKIASRHSVAGGWQGLWKLNKKTLKNPHQIKIGQVLRIR
jgi:LysM repeat protein